MWNVHSATFFSNQALMDKYTPAIPVWIVIVVRIIGLSYCHVADQGDVCMSDATWTPYQGSKGQLCQGLRPVCDVQKGHASAPPLREAITGSCEKGQINKHAMHAFSVSDSFLPSELSCLYPFARGYKECPWYPIGQRLVATPFSPLILL